MSLWVGGCVVCKSPFNLRVNLRNEPLGGHSNILESVLKKLGFVSCTFVWQSSNLEVHYRVMTNYNHVIWEESIAVKSAFILHCFFLWSEGWMGEGASLKEPGKNKTTQGERERERERENCIQIPNMWWEQRAFCGVMDQVDDDGQQKWLYSNDTKHG